MICQFKQGLHLKKNANTSNLFVHLHHTNLAQSWVLHENSLWPITLHAFIKIYKLSSFNNITIPDQNYI